jgi:uncharacterized RDD family membrane protein YckC
MEVAAASPVDTKAIGLCASWARRFGGWRIDVAFLWIVLWVLDLMLGIGARTFGVLLLWPVYFTLCHGSGRGQTLGKRVVGIAVRNDASLGQLSYARAFARWLVTGLFCTLLVPPGALDGLSPLSDGRRRTWSDKTVGSVVIRL